MHRARPSRATILPRLSTSWARRAEDYRLGQVARLDQDEVGVAVDGETVVGECHHRRAAFGADVERECQLLVLV